MKNRKNTITILIFIICIGILCGILLSHIRTNKGEQSYISLRYGDIFPKDIIQFISDDPSERTSEYEIIFYTSLYCSSCADEIPYIAEIMNSIDGCGVDTILLLDDKPIMFSYDIDNSNIALIDAHYKLSDGYPRYYITNNDEIYFSTSDLSILVEKIFTMEIINIEECRKSTITNLLNNHFRQNDKNNIIYMKMENCPDCLEADTLMKSNEVKSTFNVLEIYSNKTSDESYKVDKYNFYRYLFNINWYPSFILIYDSGSTYKLIGRSSFEEYSEMIFSNSFSCH